MNQERWDLRFLGLAKHISSWSIDPSTKVGAVIVDKKNRIISLGYNGFPRGIKDDDRLYDREKKLSIILHAEENSLLFANKNLYGCTIYTYPMFPCSKCCSKIIQSEIKRIVSTISNNRRWDESIKLSKDLCLESGVEFCTKFFENEIV